MKAARMIFGILLAILLVAVVAGYLVLRGSLPTVDGEVALDGLDAEVFVERDALGIPTIRGQSRRDVAFGTGFVHAQDRFFQMDLLRRSAAGELAALVGPKAVPKDEERRFHRLRVVAREVVAGTTPNERAILEAYTNGVNAGLDELRVLPFEYLFLRTSPEPWRAEDSVLAVHEMFFQLNDYKASREALLGEMREALPEAMFRFLVPVGTEWDAPVMGEAHETSPIPGPEVCDLRSGPAEVVARRGPKWTEISSEQELLGGSNNWAVAGAHTASGRAIVADDIHLGLRAPNVLYRLRLLVDDQQQPEQNVDLIGATVPGVPAVAVGSNRSVVWGFTNSRGDWVDLVEIELHPEDPDRYRTPDGYQEFDAFRETILVKGEESVEMVIRATRWGPVIPTDDGGPRYALRWLAHEPEAADFLDVLELERAANVREAVAIAPRIGMPPQNLVVGDVEGSIGWTILGRIPRKGGFDSSLPSSWTEQGVGWLGWLDPGEYPVVIDPPSGRIWTANARVVDSALLSGRENRYQLGARGTQIRDQLLSLEKAGIEDMLRIQLDDRALYLERWRDLLLGVLSSESDRSPQQAELQDLVERWDGRATVDAVGYRMVRAFRQHLLDTVLSSVAKGCGHGNLEPDFAVLQQSEGPLWKLVSERPSHLLDPGFGSWDEQLLATIDAASESCGDKPLAECTWGDYNDVQIRHPLSAALPWLSRWLDVQRGPLPGDDHMPRIQRKAHGAAERFAVSPGDEASGYFHMPGGQSGHPLSPHYRDQHEAWVEGKPTPFMPGEAIHRLTLTPRRSASPGG